jgi:hypothetical protein
VVGAVASWLRGARYIHDEHSLSDEIGGGLLDVGELASAQIGAGISLDEDPLSAEEAPAHS